MTISLWDSCDVRAVEAQSARLRQEAAAEIGDRRAGGEYLRSRRTDLIRTFTERLSFLDNGIVVRGQHTPAHAARRARAYRRTGLSEGASVLGPAVAA
jgi:hypothetical protein